VVFAVVLGFARAPAQADVPADDPPVDDACQGWEPEKTARSIVSFVSKPPGATVLVDDVEMCEATPCQKVLAHGEHTVTMKLERHEAVSKPLKLKGKKTLTFKLLPKFGVVSFSLDPAGVKIAIDGTETEITGGPLKLSLGEHTVSVVDPCHQASEKKFKVTRAKNQRVKMKVDPRWGGIDVRILDGEGNDLSAKVFVDAELAGRAPGVLRVPMCSRRVETYLNEHGANLELKEQQTTAVELRPTPRADYRSLTVGQAIIATATAVLQVPADPNDKPKILLEEKVGWCAVDNAAQGLWYYAPAKRGEWALKFLDLRSADSQPVAITSALPAELLPINISYGDGRTLGQILSPVSFQVGMRFDVSKNKIETLFGCEGDGGYACYEDGWQPPAKLDANLRAMLKKVGRSKAHRALSQILARRAAGHAQFSKPPKEQPSDYPTPVVPSSECQDDPDQCGDFESIPGTGHWSVVVGNSSGDFMHVMRQLYDPARRLFINSATMESSRVPFGMHVTLGAILISPSGDAYIDGGVVASFSKGIVFNKGVRHSCGWLGGGWTYSTEE
jgi:hypothetical protein